MSDLYDVARLLAARPADGDAVLARPVAFRGVGARREGEAAAVLPGGEVVGSVVGGVLDSALRAEAARAAGGGAPARLVDLPLGDAEAAAAGLACGGVLTVLLQRAGGLPARVAAALAAGEPAVLVTDLRTGEVDEGAVAVGAGGPRAAAVEEARRSGRAGARVLPAGTDGEAGEAVVEALVPTTRLLLVGSGVLADATARQAALLGWEATVVDDVAAAEASLAALGPAGAMVTFAHRAEVDDPVLTAALRGGLRYVGALGSRRTQAARRERLRAAGLGDDALDRVHGPVGLDLGARTPEETALAVCAEVLAVLSGRGAASLRDTAGSIHV